MTFRQDQKVIVVACKDDSRAVGLTGWIVDGAEPGPLTDYRWTVRFGRLLIGPALCESAELRAAD
ncbi:hypothetical protein [Kitasatospora sp. NPDC059160]|uniref:hypothetical protein n=1 Tax=Kitasatospora sp. NPDC059160 TaxID=3346748 RepID=UPI0036CD4199